MIRARRVYYTAGDKPIRYLLVRYHPDRYRFIVDLVPRWHDRAGSSHNKNRAAGGKGVKITPKFQTLAETA